MYYLLVKEKRLFNYQQKSGNDKTYAIAQRGPTTGPRNNFALATILRTNKSLNS